MHLEPGMLVKSKAGRDKNCIYVIIRVNDEYVYLADGKARTVCRAKRKNKKHLQVILKCSSTSVTDDETIRKKVEQYSRNDINGKGKMPKVRED